MKWRVRRDDADVRRDDTNVATGRRKCVTVRCERCDGTTQMRDGTMRTLLRDGTGVQRDDTDVQRDGTEARRDEVDVAMGTSTASGPRERRHRQSGCSGICKRSVAAVAICKRRCEALTHVANEAATKTIFVREVDIVAHRQETRIRTSAVATTRLRELSTLIGSRAVV
jgi:hypothetical protein